MKANSKNLGWILLLVLSTMIHASARAQPLRRQTVDPNAAQAELLWYGGHASGAVQTDASGQKMPCLAHCSPCPRVYGYAEALFLERSNRCFDQPLLVQRDEFGNPAATGLATADLQFDYEPALRIVLGFRLCEGWGIEGGYFGLWDAEATESVAPGVPLSFPDGLGAGGTTEGASVWAFLHRTWVDYSSAVHSGELNLVYCGDRDGKCEAGKCGFASAGACGTSRGRTFEWLAGFRYLDLREELRIAGQRDEIGGTASGVYDIRTINQLCGGQLGARWRCWGERLGFEATGKLGVFGNAAEQEQYITDYPADQSGAFPLRPLTGDDGTEVAFVSDLNLTAIYRLNEVWSLRAGYNLIWISGVALAPDQLDFSGTLPAGDQLHSTGSLFLHGASCGVEARW